jgi:hypothetical protein
MPQAARLAGEGDAHRFCAGRWRRTACIAAACFLGTAKATMRGLKTACSVWAGLSQAESAKRSRAHLDAACLFSGCDAFENPAVSSEGGGRRWSGRKQARSQAKALPHFRSVLDSSRAGEGGREGAMRTEKDGGRVGIDSDTTLACLRVFSLCLARCFFLSAFFL